MTDPARPGLLLVTAWDIGRVGGVGQVVENLLRVARREGRYQTILLVQSWEHVRFARSEHEIARVVHGRLPSPWDGSNRLRSLVAYLVFLRRTLAALRGLLESEQVEVVNFHFPGLQALSFALLRVFGRRRFVWILSLHGVDLRGAIQSRGLVRWLWRRLLRSADRITLCSAALQEELRGFDAAAARRSVVAHNGIDRERVAAELRQGRAPTELRGLRYVATAATLERKKGHDVLLRAFESVASALPDVHLVLMGRPGDAAEEIRSLVAGHRYRERVHLYEDVPHEDTLCVLRDAEVFALASRREPFGIAILEAGLFGRPVVCTRVGGIPEIVTEEGLGALVPPEDPPALAAALLELLRDPERAARLGKALHERVVSQFTWRAAYARYFD